MKLSMKSIGWTVVFAGLFFGLFAGIYFSVNYFFVADHYEKQFAQIKGIENINFDSGQEVTVHMERVDNIKLVFEEMEKVFNGRKYQITLIDNPSPVLLSIAEKSEIAVQEAVVRGNFTEMENYVLDIASQKGVNAKVFVDDRRVYLQLEKGEKYVYRVVDRPLTEQGVNPS